MLGLPVVSGSCAAQCGTESEIVRPMRPGNPPGVVGSNVTGASPSHEA